MRRFFVAVKPSDQFIEQVQKFKADYDDLPLRWILRENLHITLLPPWEAADYIGMIPLLESLAGRIKPFAMEFHWINYGPNERRPCLIWAEAYPTKQFVAIQNELKTAFGEPTVDLRPAKPHMTLARFSTALFPFPGLPPFPHAFAWTERVDNLSLYESVLQADGAHYRLVAKLALKLEKSRLIRI